MQRIAGGLTTVIAAVAIGVAPAIAADTLPTITRAVASGNSFSLAWTFLGKADAFTVQYSCDGGVAWQTIDMIPATQRAFSFATDQLAENCVARMAVKQDNVNSPFSEPFAPVAGPNVAPTNLQIDNNTGTISWGNTEAPGIAEYEVQSTSDEGVTWSIIGKTKAGLSGLQLPKLEPGVAYRVVAITEDGQRYASDVYRSLDEAAADAVRTGSMSPNRIALITLIGVALALLLLRLQVARRRAAKLTAGFEDFDALTRR